jgi:putative ABC transport system permease protein
MTVTIPVTALTMGLVFIKTGMPTQAERAVQYLGSADLGASDWFEPPTQRQIDALVAAAPEGSVAVARRSLGSETVFGDRPHFARVEEWPIPVDAPPIRGLYAPLSGALPTRPGDAAVHRELLAAAGASVGDELRLRLPDPSGGGGPGRTLVLRVTGTIENPHRLDELLAVVGPGTLDGMRAQIDKLLFDLPARISLEDRRSFEEALGADAAGGGYLYREDAGLGEDNARLVANAAALGGTALALFGTGLVAAAAFVMGARRQLRALGLVAAAGGDPGQVRRVVLMGGVVLGAVGSVLGVGLGLLLSVALFPTAEQVANQRLGVLEFPGSWLIGAGLLGTAAATLAAFGPARAAGRLSPVDALAGRPAPPKPPGGLARRGLILLTLGVAATFGATVVRSIPGIIAGLLMMVGGFLLSIPLVATWTGRLGGRLPATLRLAARDVSRHGRRTGAALAAATMVLALPVSVSALTLSEESSRFGDSPPMAADHLVLTLSPQTRDRAGEQREFLDAMRRAVPDALIAPLRQAEYPKGHPDDPNPEDLPAPVFVEGPQIVERPGAARTATGPLFIGDANLLRALHAEDGTDALADGSVVGIGPGGVTAEGTVTLPSFDGSPSQRSLPAVSAGDTRYSAIGFWGEFLYVVSPERAAELKVRPVRNPPEGFLWILRAQDSLRPAAVEAAQLAAFRIPGGYANTLSNYGEGLGSVRLILTGVAALIALIIVGVVVALVTAESRRDHAILVAVGAGPLMRRKVVGANAWLLATLGGLLAVPAGFLPVVVIQAARQAGKTVVVPWLAITVAVAALPLIAALISAAVSRRPKAAQLLRPIG